MQIFFIDESGTIPPPDRTDDVGFFALGSVVIPELVWHDLDRDIAFLKRQYGIKGEIKWRYFSPHKKSKSSSSFSHLDSHEKNSLRENLYGLLKKYPSVVSICSIVNVKKAYQLQEVVSQNDLYWFAYKAMAIKFQDYLKSLSQRIMLKTNGIIVCDHRQPKDDFLLRHAHQKLFSPDEVVSSEYSNLIEGVFIAPSHLSVGIQFADLIGGAVFRKFARNDDRYYEMVKPIIARVDQGLLQWPGDFELRTLKERNDAVSV